MKMVVTRMIGVTAVAVMLAMGAGSVMADSSTWEGSSFEADALAPTNGAPNWHGFSTNGTVVADGGNNYINFGPTGALDGVRTLNYVVNAGTNGGASFEVRARHNGGSHLDVWGHIFTSAAAGDSYYNWLTYYIESGQVRINNSNNFNLGTDTLAVDTSEWHAYRFTIDGTNWKLYVDDDPTPALTLAAIPNADEPIPYTGYFGMFHGYGGSTDVDLDYLRYTDMGAIPVPEPATMAILGLGGSLMLRRLRRRNR